MARIEEKVKDIIEVRPHVASANFERDSAKAVAAYHFTDITADLMAKWLGRALEASAEAGAANALAGFRGVGKSHFLAAFGGLLRQAELRGRIEQTHVAAVLSQFHRKSLPVAFVRRGSRTTLAEEIWDALSETFAGGIQPGGSTLTDVLAGAVEKAADSTLVILIDTAFDRLERVSRDDGAELGEIAEFARTNNLFVGIALDDDIAGADGANSAISKTFKIDYLDQEHLYKIVDSHIFPKHPRMLPVLERIYDEYRSAVPAFRWSSSRFSSLYPLHPAIMELAPFVRLYLPEFALLGFAAEAGARILGRPADSLIAPDEVFDNVEKLLRSVTSLEESFAAFDRVNDSVVANTPVMKRLQAKLILKGLLLFSLNDEGITAAEIGASMLIYDEKQPEAAVAEIDEVLKAFAASAPDAIRTSQDSSGETRYVFQVSAKSDLKSAVVAAAESVSDEDVRSTLRLLMNERFVDCDFDSPDNASVDSMAVTADWRGGKRRGRIVWNPSAEWLSNEAGNRRFEWEIRVVFDDLIATDTTATAELPAAVWKPAPLSESEREVISGLWVLLNDTTLRNQFKDHLAAAVQTQTVAADKVFKRAFLDESILSIDGFDYNLLDEARDAESLKSLSSVMLDSLFAARYSLHPILEKPLEMSAVSSLTADFFSGARPNQTETQANARDFALPLGLATENDNGFAPLSGEKLLDTDFASLVLDAVKAANGAAKLDTIFARLSATPYGLTAESAYLVLGALAGQQLIDFVTTTGNRINRRSLDLKLVWDDLAAIAEPEIASYSKDELVAWARMLTGNEAIKTLSDEQFVKESLNAWLKAWHEGAIEKHFEALEDDELTARIWRLAIVAIRPFASAAGAIEKLNDGSISLAESIRGIAADFADSEAEFERRRDELAAVQSFVSLAPLRRKATRYTALTEYAGDDEVDSLRAKLIDQIDESRLSGDPAAHDELATTWENFRRAYIDLYMVRHARSAVESRERLEEIQNTEMWQEFDGLSSIQAFAPEHRINARRLINRIAKTDCTADVENLLKVDPVCVCGFTFDSIEKRDKLPDQLSQIIGRGLAEYKDVLLSRIGEIEAAASTSTDADIADAARMLTQSLLMGDSTPHLSPEQISVVRSVFSQPPQDAFSSASAAQPNGVQFNGDEVLIPQELELEKSLIS